MREQQQAQQAQQRDSSVQVLTVLCVLLLLPSQQQRVHSREGDDGTVCSRHQRENVTASFDYRTDCYARCVGDNNNSSNSSSMQTDSRCVVCCCGLWRCAVVAVLAVPCQMCVCLRRTVCRWRV